MEDDEEHHIHQIEKGEEVEEVEEVEDDMTVDDRAVVAGDVLHRCAEHQHCSLPYSVVQ